MTFEELKNFEELKKTIKESLPKYNLLFQKTILLKDKFEINSSLYDDIPCDNISSVKDIYGVIEKYNLDPELFKKPYYISVYLSSFDENTINIINQLDDNVYVEIIIDIINDVNEAQLLSKISHKKCQYNLYNGTIDLDSMSLLSDRNILSEESSPLIVIKKIDSMTAEKISNVSKKNKNLRFKVEIKDLESLQNIGNIVPYIPENEIPIFLDDNIFSEKNSQNARNTIIQNTKGNDYIDKKLNIYFREIKYDAIEQVYDLEKNMELIKSHIPANASELDIITYITLFVCNYFQYDYNMAEKNEDGDNEDISLPQFVSRGRGVCRHFASFTEYILNSLGVKCERLDSYNLNGEEGHSFNLVEIQGKSYFLDNTWISEKNQIGLLSSLAESNDFLTSNEKFGHEDYKHILDGYNCENYERKKIIDSVNRVINWNNIYVIHPQALRDLFRKYILKKEKSVAERIEDAIPRRK